MSNVIDAIPEDARKVIVRELESRGPLLLAELRAAQKPTVEQSNAVEDKLYDALSENYGPGHVPNEHGLAVEHAIGAYLDTWPTDG